MINRRDFVNMAAGAAGAAAMGIVPEDDPAIAVERVELRRPDVAMPMYCARPRGAKAATPGVTVVMHAWGVDESIREFVRRLAKAGFSAVAPDLYARLHAPSGDGQDDFSVFSPYVRQLMASPEQVDGDVRAAGLWLKQAHPRAKIAVSGFCMGGIIALRQALTNADVFSADAVWYGNVKEIDASKIGMPIVGSYGARDASIPPDSVEAFRKALRVPNDIVVYPDAGHAFFDNHRKSYVADAAADSWKRASAFLTKYLSVQGE